MELGMEAHNFNPAGTQRQMNVWGQPVLQIEFQDNQGHNRETLSQKKIDYNV